MCVSPHLANFVFLVEMGFHHVGQAGLKFLTSGDLAHLASKSAGITGRTTSPCLKQPFEDQVTTQGRWQYLSGMKQLSIIYLYALNKHSMCGAVYPKARNYNPRIKWWK